MKLNDDEMEILVMFVKFLKLCSNLRGTKKEEELVKKILSYNK